MKTKLTLTVRKKVIDSAKRIARKRQVSLSQLFEEVFENQTVNPIKSEPQLAAERLIFQLENSKELKEDNDKKELIDHVKRKFA